MRISNYIAVISHNKKLLSLYSFPINFDTLCVRYPLFVRVTITFLVFLEKRVTKSNGYNIKHFFIFILLLYLLPIYYTYVLNK